MRWSRSWPRASRCWRRNWTPSIPTPSPIPTRSAPSPTGSGSRLQVTFHPAGKGDLSFDIVPGSAVLVEDSGDDPDTSDTKPTGPAN